MNAVPVPASSPNQPESIRVARFPGLRALIWDGEILYAARGYDLLRVSISVGKIQSGGLSWERVASFHPAWWRSLITTTNLSARLFRDGFHALAILPSSALVAAVPGAIVTCAAGQRDFEVTHTIKRGTRPLHIAALPNGTVVWGEYFDNAARDEVYIYASPDHGATWHVAYTFPKNAIRHVHNIVYDPWADCLWILTGDYGSECRILRASNDFSSMHVALEGHQQARAVALVPARDGLYFSSDTPLECNYVYHLDRRGALSKLFPLSTSSIYGCRVGEDVFFSTMVEPSKVNSDRQVYIYGSHEGKDWHPILAWQKDRWSMSLFQYGNIILPDGINGTAYLAATTMAVKQDDMVTSLYSIQF